MTSSVAAYQEETVILAQGQIAVLDFIIKEGTGGLHTCQRDAGCALDVIIEDTCMRAVLVEQLKGIVVGKVLKLDQHMRLPLPQCRHEACHYFMVCSASQSMLSESLQAVSHRKAHFLLLPQKKDAFALRKKMESEWKVL
jgi:hypothetical protein